MLMLILEREKEKNGRDMNWWCCCCGIYNNKYKKEMGINLSRENNRVIASASGAGGMACLL